MGRSFGEGKGYQIQYSGLENFMDYPWSCKESDMTEQLSLSFVKFYLSRTIALIVEYMLGAGLRSSTCGKGHEGGGSAYAKAGSSLRSPPGNSRASTPKTRVCLLSALTYTSDFIGGCPPLPLSEKRVSLQLQLIIPGCDSVSTYNLLWKSSSLPE